jgi:small GTP-binding protein
MVIFAKICILGDGRVGKTSLRSRYMGKDFKTGYLPTLGADFSSITVNIPMGKEEVSIRYQIWDLAGQPTFSQIRALYYYHAVGALLVYDIGNRSSFQNLQYWIKELMQHSGSPSVFINVLGNKSDLRNEDSITTEEVEEYLSKDISLEYENLKGSIDHFETSAKTGKNVEKAFTTLGRKILDRYH